MALEDEQAFYRAHRAEFVRAFLGRWVLIKGQALIGVFPTDASALEEAVARFGTGPYLIKRVLDPEPVERI